MRQENELMRWTADLELACKEFLALISKSAKRNLKFYDPSLMSCVFTDASKEFLSGVLSQCTAEEIVKSVEDEQKLPIMFFSGKFTDSQRKWHVSHQELHP